MVLHGIVLLALARGLYLARHLPTLYDIFLIDITLSDGRPLSEDDRADEEEEENAVAARDTWFGIANSTGQ